MLQQHCFVMIRHVAIPAIRGRLRHLLPRRSMSTVIPYVIDRGEGGVERTYDIYSRLLEDRIVFVQGTIEDTLANSVVAQLLFLESKAPEKPIHMYINSPGGQVTSGMAIYDTMQYISSPVHTLCMGMAASMAATLLMGGEKGRRRALPFAEVMVHQPLGGAQGSASDVERTVQNLLQTRARMNKLYAHHTGQPLDVIERTLDRDTYLTAEEAMAFGIIDEVVKRRSKASKE